MEDVVPGDHGAANGTPEDASVCAKKMNIGEISAWLTENGKEEVVWNLKQKKAKKAEFVNAYVAAHTS